MSVIVVGGGLAGLRIAKKLDALLITNNESFTFLPRLPDSLRKGESYATRSIADSHNKVEFGTVTRIDTEKKMVFVGKKSFSYEYLVLATGATSVLPVPGAKEYAIPFYTFDDVRKVVQKLPVKKVVIVGAGPTGVEVAAELSSSAKVILLQGDSEILPTYPASARKYARKELARLGVGVRTKEFVERVTANSVVTKTDSFPYDICVWCAGVRTDIPSGVPTHKGVLVDEFLQVKGRANVFAAGDCAQSGAPLTAQAAVQEADLVIENIRLLKQQKALKKYSYHHKGDMLSLRNKAIIVSTQGVAIKGRIAAWARSVYYWWQLRSY